MIIHKTRQQARQGYADCLEYTVKNAIPLTEEAEEDIKKARKYWIGAKQGKSFEQIKREENNGKLAKLNQEKNRKFLKLNQENIKFAKKLNQTAAVKSSSVYDGDNINKKQHAARMIELCSEKHSSENRSAEKSKPRKTEEEL